MIGTLVTRYHHYQAVEASTAPEDVCHTAAMMAIETRSEIEERVNAILKGEGVTLEQLVKVMTR